MGNPETFATLGRYTPDGWSAWKTAMQYAWVLHNMTNAIGSLAVLRIDPDETIARIITYSNATNEWRFVR